MENIEDLTQEELEEIDEHPNISCQWRFLKLKFKINPNMSRPSTPFRKDMVNKVKDYVDIDENFKRFNCGIVGHFSNECRKA